MVFVGNYSPISSQAAEKPDTPQLKSANGGYTKVKTTKDLSFTDTGLVKGMTYYYKARGYKKKGDYLFIQFGHNDRNSSDDRVYTPLGTANENNVYPVKAGTQQKNLITGLLLYRN